MASHILILEEDLDQQFVLTELLQRLGYFAHCVGDCKAAREMLINHQFEALVADISGNCRDYLNFLQETNTRYRLMPIVVIGKEEHCRKKCEALGLEFYLSKPLNLFSLSRLLQNLLEQTEESSAVI